MPYYVEMSIKLLIYMTYTNKIIRRCYSELALDKHIQTYTGQNSQDGTVIIRKIEIPNQFTTVDRQIFCTPYFGISK